MDNSDDVLNFDSVSEDDLGIVNHRIDVDDVSSSSDGYVSSSSEESENEDDRKTKSLAWGAKKSNYYGGIEDDIDEDGLELQEAKELEQNQMKQMQKDDFALSDDEEEDVEAEEEARMNLGFGIMEEEVRKDISELSDRELQKIIRKENPELLVMLPDLQKRFNSLSTTIKPMVDASKKEPSVLPDGRPLSETGKRIIDSKSQIQMNYCMLALNYMLLKAEKKDMREHPIMPYLVKSRSLSDKMDSVEMKMKSNMVHRIPKRERIAIIEEDNEEEIEEDQSSSEVEMDPALLEEEDAFSRPVRSTYSNQSIKKEEEEEIDEDLLDLDEEILGKRRRIGKEDDEHYEEMIERRENKKKEKEGRKKWLESHVREDFVLEEGQSRKATQKILKNRGMVASRSKENRNPRVKKRLRYQKAIKNRKGQVADVRTNEMDQYRGERTGIRKDVVHARLFK